MFVKPGASSDPLQGEVPKAACLLCISKEADSKHSTTGFGCKDLQYDARKHAEAGAGTTQHNLH